VTGAPFAGKHEKIPDWLEEAPGHAVNGGLRSIQTDIAGDHEAVKLQNWRQWQKWRQCLNGLIGNCGVNLGPGVATALPGAGLARAKSHARPG
jgi:hypothetical protein